MFEYILLVLLIVYISYDLNYIIRTLFTILSGRILEKPLSLSDTTTIYGICTFLDCDITFKSLRLARLLREIDIARYHYYDRTGIYQRSKLLNIRSLQGCTLTSTKEPVGLFQWYKIITKLIYWDNRSLFLGHQVMTLSDGKVRNVIVSRQYAIWKHGDSTEALLKGLISAGHRPPCPDYIQSWLHSMEISSGKLRKEILLMDSSL